MLKHRNIKHCAEDKQEGVSCNICGKKCNERSELMNHRKTEHKASVGVCRKFLQKSCPFSENYCWWRHSETVHTKGDQVGETFECSECGKQTTGRGELMKHRKSEHSTSVAVCKNHLKGQCRFDHLYCWYKHETPEDVVFQKAPQTTDPPYKFQKDPTSL